MAELVCEEVARAWKKAGGGAIVDDGVNTREQGKQGLLASILSNLESCMSGGRVRPEALEKRVKNLAISGSALGARDERTGGKRNFSNGGDMLDDNNGDDDIESLQTRSFIKVVSAFDQPRLVYNITKRHFDLASKRASLFAPVSERVNLFRERYNLIYQRLLRHDLFTASTLTPSSAYKLTSIENLLGRSGTSHLLLGMLSHNPVGDITLSDPTGSVILDLSDARAVPADGAWFTPGMLVLVEGIYEEDEGDDIGMGLHGVDGVGGTVGGRFAGVSIGGPPCERRHTSVGVRGTEGDEKGASVDSGFGWVDFLGVGSERGDGARMRRTERMCLAQRQQKITLLSSQTQESQAREGSDIEPTQNASNMDKSYEGTTVILSEIHLNEPRTLSALERVFKYYSNKANDTGSIPAAFILMGSFVSHAIMSRNAGNNTPGAIEYKEHFDVLTSLLSQYPKILRNSTFVFVPGDNDPWAAVHSAGASTVVPRHGVPEMFTSRVRKAFERANREGQSTLAAKETKKEPGKAIWTSNPTRLAIFGPVHEMVIFRDDISGRLRRNSLVFGPQNGEDDDYDMNDEDPRENENENEKTNHDTGMSIDQQEDDKAEWSTRPSASRLTETPSPPQSSARKLVKTIIDQSHLSPFPLSLRPIIWSHAYALSLYPLPNALVLADSEAEAFALTYEGCHVMNPGRLVPEGSKGLTRWIEYDLGRKRGVVIEEKF